MGELHKRFGPALAELANTAGVIRVLGESDDAPVWWPEGVDWTRTYGAFEPEKPAYATLVFEAVDQPALGLTPAGYGVGFARPLIVLVKAYRQLSDSAPPGAWIHTMPEVGSLHVRVFPDDPRLSTLASVIEAEQAVGVVRYRPEKRCTLRIGSGPETSWAKVFPDLAGEAIHRIQEALWAASQEGELDVAVAPPIRFAPLLGRCG